ncbi:MAG: hypothetical protein CVV47_10700 [Spirochaetae bacterium HGW-Spirochaetae-3]|jgi:alpha-beta hydrolase superfamily lysophospholipase|nr:MAG: hypothetical protein CVV47_10700 [Spirochaetae bacterium HGW-Spirochaetae-3]
MKPVAIAFFTIMSPFALYGLWKAVLGAQKAIVGRRVAAVEARRTYDPVLRYHRDGGEPLFLVSPKHDTTLFFLEGFRTQSPAGMYRERFQKLFETGVNVIVPVYGLQSSPFDLRNRDWRLEEDLRLVGQVYDAYAATLAPGHRIIVCAQSFGAIPASSVAAFSSRRPDALVFLSPHNAELDFRVSGPMIRWLSRQSAWLRHLVRFSWAAPAPGRASVWDIVDTDRNLATAARGDANPEDATEYGYRNELAARLMEASILPAVSGYDAWVVCGERDLYFAQSGFDRFASALRSGGNRVVFDRLAGSGHMVLLDADADRAWAAIFAAIGKPVPDSF